MITCLGIAREILCCLVLVLPKFDIFSCYYETNNLNTANVVFLYFPADDRGLQVVTPIPKPDKIPYISSDRIYYIIVIIQCFFNVKCMEIFKCFTKPH